MFVTLALSPAVAQLVLVRRNPMADVPRILTPTDLMKQRDEAFTELVKALLIINGGGAVALLAFLQTTWVQSKALIGVVVVAIAAMAAGALVAAAVHLLRYQASWSHQSGETAKWARFRRLYLFAASLSLILFAIVLVVFF